MSVAVVSANEKVAAQVFTGRLSRTQNGKGAPLPGASQHKPESSSPSSYVQHLKSDAVADITHEIWSYFRLKTLKNNPSHRFEVRDTYTTKIVHYISERVFSLSQKSSEDLSQFYRRLNQSTPPTVSPISSGSFHSGFSPDPSSQESLISMEVAVGLPPLLSPSADRDPQWEAMRAVSRSLSLITQVHHIGEGAIYESEPWMVRRPDEEEFRAAAWEEIRERWMVRRPVEEFRAAAPAAWEEIRGWWCGDPWRSSVPPLSRLGGNPQHPRGFPIRDGYPHGGTPLRRPTNQPLPLNPVKCPAPFALRIYQQSLFDCVGIHSVVHAPTEWGIDAPRAVS
ncbi:hypothetical protein J6590_023223 [Homalodisca vitripennis]|nr:hypothetical protein J6590_023223 [Homalodisca vitripennis]